MKLSMQVVYCELVLCRAPLAFLALQVCVAPKQNDLGSTSPSPPGKMEGKPSAKQLQALGVPLSILAHTCVELAPGRCEPQNSASSELAGCRCERCSLCLIPFGFIN